MERIGPDQALPEFIGKEDLYGVILKTTTGQQSNSVMEELLKRSRVFLAERGFEAVSVPQRGDIVGYAVENPPYTPLSSELNLINWDQYSKREQPWINHYGIIVEGMQVLSRGSRDGQLYRHSVWDPEVLGKPERKVYFYRKAQPTQETPRRRGRRSKT